MEAVQCRASGPVHADCGSSGLGSLLRCCPERRAPPPPAPRPVAVLRAGTLDREDWRPHRHCVCQPSWGHFKPGSPPGPHALDSFIPFPQPLVFTLQEEGSTLFPRAPMPGCPCDGGGLGVFINKALALTGWQSHQRAWRASVSKLEFGPGSPM